jgi:hypothetical protein
MASPSPPRLPACFDLTAAPSAPAGVRSTVPVWTLADGLNQPDDLVFHQGRVYVGELGSGAIAVVIPGRPPARLAQVVPRVEGLAWIGDTLYAADQQNDRVDSLTADGPVRTFVQLEPVAGRDSIDGIATDGTLLIVPDAAQGVVNWYDTAGRLVRQVGGFVRPSGAWPLPDGSVLIADEYGNSAVQVGVDGSRRDLVTGLPIVDDAAQDAEGKVFVVTPVVSGGRLAQVAGGTASDFSSNLLEPQGLGFDGATNVLVTESAAGRLDLFLRTFKLVPVGGSPARGQPLCVHLARAPGFTSPIQLAGPGITVVRQPGADNAGEVLLPDQGCPPAGCLLTASSGTLVDTLWITA